MSNFVGEKVSRTLQLFEISEDSFLMSYDDHVLEELGNACYVRSLYFDNDISTNFYEKIDSYRTITFPGSWSRSSHGS